MTTSGERLAARAFAEGLAPPESLTVSQWADRNRQLGSRSTNEVGRWRTDRVPYLREIMDSLSVSSPVREVWFMKGAQVGATEAGNNWLGYVVCEAPGPMLYLLPTEKLGKKVARQRFEPLFEDTPALAERVTKKKSRASGNTMLSKEFPGGMVVFGSSNSASELRSMSLRYVFGDEVDAYPVSVEEEGDPIKLAQRGQRTYKRSRKSFLVSTPTIEGRSRIQSGFLRTDQRHYHVPCPLCGEFQPLEWPSIEFDEDDPASVRYRCRACRDAFEERHKERILAAGKWIPHAPEKASPRIRGYHLSALYSPLGWYGWDDAVADFLEAKEDVQKLKVFVNHTLGQTWRQRGDPPPWERLYNRREQYLAGVAPPGVLFVTVGADLQQDRLELEFVGWGRRRESWSLDYVVIPGKPESQALWNQLDQELDRRFVTPGGVELPVRMAAIDANFQSSFVYAYCRRRGPSQTMAVLGRDGQQVLLSQPRAVDIRQSGQRVRRGAKVWLVGTDLAKSELYAWLRLEQPTEPSRTGYPPGFVHFPEREPEWFKQLTAEHITWREVAGVRKYYWEKHRERNEALDCRVYARAAAAVVGMDRWSEEHWDQLEASLGASTREARPAKKRERKAQRGLGKGPRARGFLKRER